MAVYPSELAQRDTQHLHRFLLARNDHAKIAIVDDAVGLAVFAAFGGAWAASLVVRIAENQMLVEVDTVVPK